MGHWTVASPRLQSDNSPVISTGLWHHHHGYRLTTHLSFLLNCGSITMVTVWQLTCHFYWTVAASLRLQADNSPIISTGLWHHHHGYRLTTHLSFLLDCGSTTTVTVWQLICHFYWTVAASPRLQADNSPVISTGLRHHHHGYSLTTYLSFLLDCGSITTVTGWQLTCHFYWTVAPPPRLQADYSPFISTGLRHHHHGYRLTTHLSFLLDCGSITTVTGWQLTCHFYWTVAAPPQLQSDNSPFISAGLWHHHRGYRLTTYLSFLLDSGSTTKVIGWQTYLSFLLDCGSTTTVTDWQLTFHFYWTVAAPPQLQIDNSPFISTGLWQHHHSYRLTTHLSFPLDSGSEFLHIVWGAPLSGDTSEESFSNEESAVPNIRMRASAYSACLCSRDFLGCVCTGFRLRAETNNKDHMTIQDNDPQTMLFWPDVAYKHNEKQLSFPEWCIYVTIPLFLI